MKVMIEGQPANPEGESAEEERKEKPTVHELDMHHRTLVDAEEIRNDPHIMKHLVPHMQKKATALKMAMNKSPAGSAMAMPDDDTGKQADKITSVDGLRKKYKSMA